MGTLSMGLYRPGDSFVHRTPASSKLITLILLGVATVWIGKIWWVTLLSLVVVVAIYLAAGFSLRDVWQQWRPVRWILVFTFVMNWWAAGWESGWQRGISVTGTITLLVLAAALVTLTTPTTDLVDVLVRAVGPLRRFGVDPERFGIIVLIGIRCVPVVAGLAYQVREAQVARRATHSIGAFAVPLIVSAIRDAETMGEALTARGFDD